MQQLKTDSTAKMSSTGTGYSWLHGTQPLNATVEEMPLPATPTPPGAARESSVDRLIESPGYEPITMADLWKIADRAHDVVSRARRHLPIGDPGKDILFTVGDQLIVVQFYTCELRWAQ